VRASRPRRYSPPPRSSPSQGETRAAPARTTRTRVSYERFSPTPARAAPFRHASASMNQAALGRCSGGAYRLRNAGGSFSTERSQEMGGATPTSRGMTPTQFGFGIEPPLHSRAATPTQFGFGIEPPLHSRGATPTSRGMTPQDSAPCGEGPTSRHGSAQFDGSFGTRGFRPSSSV
jgi:hypothetical protein